jgi:hypothetical protein
VKKKFLSALLIAGSLGGWSIPSVVFAQDANGRFATGVFVKKPNMATPRLSPDGSKLAYLMNDNGRAVLAIQDLSKPGSKPTIILAGEEARESGDRTVGTYRWVGNDNLVVTI